MRLIDADALKEKAFGKRGGLIHTEDIDNAPTIQPECKRGRWISLPQKESFVRWEHYQCSVCGNEFAMIDTPEPGGVYCFCPICGADMRTTE